MQGISTNLTGVINETDVRGQAMVALIKKYLNVQTYHGFQPLGDNPQFRYPCIFVEPAPGQVPDLATTGKYKLTINYVIYWFVLDNSAQDIVSLCTSIGENLIKLFSNNALNDLGTANPPSHNFRAYEPYWTDSNMKSVSYVPTLQNVIEQHSEKYMRRGRMQIEIETWVIK